MAFRFIPRIRIAPGVRLDLSPSRPGISLGPRGLLYTLEKGGGRR
ncbi:MAG: DUF4236 domain-containing protein, partial [Bradymonadaceae bacterium]